MKRRALFCSLVVNAVFLITIQTSFADAEIALFKNLSGEDQQKVKNGEPVALFEEVPDALWPKATIFKKVEASPEESVAVFADSDLQVKYVTGLTQSKISNHIDPFTYDVEYTLALPFGFGHENYTVRNHLTPPAQGTYRVDWTLVKADTTLKSDGSAIFEPFGTGTLMTYSSFVVPSRFGSGFSWVVELEKNSVKNTVSAIVQQIEDEKANQPDLLSEQLKTLRDRWN